MQANTSKDMQIQRNTYQYKQIQANTNKIETKI